MEDQAREKLHDLIRGIENGDEERIRQFFMLVTNVMERELRLPSHFFSYGSIDMTDWELVIKSAIVAEVALGEAIRRSVRHDPTWLNTRPSQGLGAKIRIAGDRDLLDGQHLNHLREISRMRNLCAHDRAGLDFTFEAYLSKASNRRSFTHNLGPIMDANEAESAPYREGVFRTPSTAVTGSLLLVCYALLKGRRDNGHLH
jgi:hypothetical protein